VRVLSHEIYFIKQKKSQKMKKFIAIAFIAASFAACNNSGKGKDAPADTTKTETPAPTPAPTGGDTTHTGDTMHAGDTTPAPKM
jgi:predicted small secreted protein